MLFAYYTKIGGNFGYL